MRSNILPVASFFAALVSLASAAANPFKVPAGGYSFKTGVPAVVNWDPTTQGTITLRLQSGSVTGIGTGDIIACMQFGVSYFFMKRDELTVDFTL